MYGGIVKRPAMKYRQTREKLTAVGEKAPKPSVRPAKLTAPPVEYPAGPSKQALLPYEMDLMANMANAFSRDNILASKLEFCSHIW